MRALRESVGDVVVVGLGGAEPDRGLAGRIRVADGEEVVVVAAPAGAGMPEWEALATAIGPGRKDIRLVVDGGSTEVVDLLTGWLSERLGRAVTSTRSPVVGAGGWVFAAGDAWRQFRPGRDFRVLSPRYPTPAWDDELTAARAATSSQAVCEPLPAGVWLRPSGSGASLTATRDRLIMSLPPQRHAVTLVVGLPGGRPVSLDDVRRVRNAFPDALRRTTRLAPLGPVALPRGESLGQALADLSGEELLTFTGVPVTAPGSELRVRAIRSRGDAGIWPFALEVRHRPRSAGRGGPEVVAHRPPFSGLPEIQPAVYGYGPGTVIEVVQSGLLLRAPAESEHAARVRAVEPLETGHRIVLDADGAAALTGLRAVAAGLLESFDETTRAACEIVTAGDLLGVPVARPAPVAPPAPAPATPVALRLESDGASPAAAPVREIQAPAGPPEPRPEPRPQPAPARPAPAPVQVEEAPAQVQEAPERSLRAGPQVGSIDGERTWLRSWLGAEFGTLANAVSRVLSEHPGFEGLRDDSTAALTDAIAVRLYLSPAGPAVNAGLRAGRNGPHVPFTRCLVAGLQRLPSHRGVTALSGRPTAAEWALYRRRPQLVDWGLVDAAAAPLRASGPDDEGDTDVLIWSMTGRRSKLLEPDPVAVPNRVLFVPGTGFKVLDLSEPAGGRRGLVLLREVARDQVGGDSLDELAVGSLRSEYERAQDASRRGPGRPWRPVADRLPGLR